MRSVEKKIHSRNGSTRSVDDQIAIAHTMWKEDVGPNHDGIKANEIEDELELELDYTVRTSLGHLNEINLVEEFAPPGPETLVIATWRDDGDGEVVNGNVTEAAEQALGALSRDICDDTSSEGDVAISDGSGNVKRSVVASRFNVVPDKVDEFLRTTDRPVDILNEAVEAIEEHSKVEMGIDYGEIAFINMPYRYRLTEHAVDLYEE